MAVFSFLKGQGALLAITAASVTGQTYQLKDFAGVEISASNKGFFWKVNQLTYNATQNTVDKPHVGTDKQDTLATTKTFEGTIELDLIHATSDITLVGTTTTLHAISPKTIYKQVIEGSGQSYTGIIYVGCDLKANAANGNEDHADVDTADFAINLIELIFTGIPFTATPGEVNTVSIPVKFKSSTLT